MPGGGPGGPPPSMGPGGPGNPAAAHRAAQNASENGSPQKQTVHGGVQFGPVGRWWDDKTVVHSVGITVDQKRKMDTIFNENKPAILTSYQTYLKEQARLSSLSRDAQADQATTFAAIDAVNQARAALQKATAQMFLQLRQQMSPEQIEKLEKLE